MALGPENFQIEVAEFYVDAVRVIPGVPIEVDPAISHTVGARYKVRNIGASAIQWWECCLTVYDVTNTKAIGSKNDHGQGGISDWKERHISVGYIGADTTFRIRIWANQDYGAAPPPQSEW